MTLRYKVLSFLFCFVAVVVPSGSNAQWFSPGSPKRNDFKITMLSLGSGSSRFTYERAFSESNSAELTLGIVGMGWDWMNDSAPRGLLVKAAYKWRLLSIRADRNWLDGFYLKPELVVAGFDYRVSPRRGGDYSTWYHTNQVALLAECGVQFLFWNWLVLDIYAGLGPSFGTGNGNNYYHSFMLFPTDGVLAFTAGYRIGLAF